jgi:hypothetical protein
MAAAGGNVRMQLLYSWAIPDVETPALAGWDSIIKDTAFVATDQYKEKFIDFGDISAPAAANESAIMLVYLVRLATSVNDTYSTNKDHGTPSANLGLHFADAHYEPVKAGTATKLGPT